MIVLILCLGLVLTSFSFSKDYSEYVEVIRKYYEEKQNDAEVIKNWTSGIKDNYKANLDYLVNDFESTGGSETTDGKVVIIGVFTTTAFCTKEGNKIRILQVYGMAILMTKDKKLVKSLKLTEVSHIVKLGWDGKDV